MSNEIGVRRPTRGRWTVRPTFRGNGREQAVVRYRSRWQLVYVPISDRPNRRWRVGDMGDAMAR